MSRRCLPFASLINVKTSTAGLTTFSRLCVRILSLKLRSAVCGGTLFKCQSKTFKIHAEQQANITELNATNGTNESDTDVTTTSTTSAAAVNNDTAPAGALLSMVEMGFS